MSDEPKTLSEAVQWCLDHMSDEFKTGVKAEISKGQRPLLHFGFGTFVRNSLGLWSERSADLREAIWNEIGPARQEKYNRHWAKYEKTANQYQGQNMFADDASGEILDALVERLRVSA